jgi:hypothetical protein
MTSKVTVLNSVVTVESLEIKDSAVAEFLEHVEPVDRAGALFNAVQVGVFCLSRAQASRDTEFVRRQIEGLMSDVTLAVAKIPTATQEALVSKIGTSNGQVLAPIQSLLDQVQSTTAARLREVRDILARDIDPAQESSTLGRALRAMRDLLDPQRTDSLQGSFHAALTKISSDDGPLARSLKATLGEALQPIQREIVELAKEVRGKDAAAEILASTTLKGFTYEEEVLAEIQQWARSTSAEVHHIGGDNQPGDILVRLPESTVIREEFPIIVEVRDRQTGSGRKCISDSLARAMEMRGAAAAIYVSKTSDGLAREIGDWAEGVCERGRWIACTGVHILTAIRFLLVQEHIARLRQQSREIDAASVDSQLQRIRTALDRVKKISRKTGEVRGLADEVQQEAEAMRDEIRSALVSIDDLVRTRIEPPAYSPQLLAPAAEQRSIGLT